MELSLKKAAEFLFTSPNQVRQWIKHDNLPAHKIFGSFKFSSEEILEWAAQHGKGVNPNFLNCAETKDEDILYSLTSALESGGIFFDIPGDTKAEVITEAAKHLPLPPDINREVLTSVLLAREAIGSTGIGNGIAIPHPRTPILLATKKPIVALFFLKNAIDYDAIDKKPVSILFTIIASSIKVHLHLLSRLAYVLQNADVNKALKKQLDKDNLLKILSTIEMKINQDKK